MFPKLYRGSIYTLTVVLVTVAYAQCFYQTAFGLV
jgi:hypothetical protein